MQGKLKCKYCDGTGWVKTKGERSQQCQFNPDTQEIENKKSSKDNVESKGVIPD